MYKKRMSATKKAYLAGVRAGKRKAYRSMNRKPRKTNYRKFRRY